MGRQNQDGERARERARERERERERERGTTLLLIEATARRREADVHVLVDLRCGRAIIRDLPAAINVRHVAAAAAGLI